MDNKIGIKKAQETCAYSATRVVVVKMIKSNNINELEE